MKSYVVPESNPVIVQLVAGATTVLVTAPVTGIGGALFVAGDYYRLSAVEGPVVFAFFVAMLATNFICRKVASWCLD